jgi:hypothetical protein
VIPTLRADSNPVEFLWTACALLGLLIGCFMLRETWLGLGALRHYGVNGVRRREATRDLRTSLGFVLIFLTFAEVGLGAMFSPPPVYSAGVGGEVWNCPSSARASDSRPSSRGPSR